MIGTLFDTQDKNLERDAFFKFAVSDDGILKSYSFTNYPLNRQRGGGSKLLSPRRFLWYLKLAGKAVLHFVKLRKGLGF